MIKIELTKREIEYIIELVGQDETILDEQADVNEPGAKEDLKFVRTIQDKLDEAK